MNEDKGYEYEQHPLPVGNCFVVTPFCVNNSRIFLEKTDENFYYLRFDVTYKEPFKILIWFNVIVKDHEQQQITSELVKQH